MNSTLSKNDWEYSKTNSLKRPLYNFLITVKIPFQVWVEDVSKTLPEKVTTLAPFISESNPNSGVKVGHSINENPWSQN